MIVVCHEDDYFEKTPIEKQRVCCNCRNRKTSETVSECMIDGHYISYIQCFTNWCRHWATDELTLQTPQTYGKSINPSNAEVVEDLISREDAIDALYAYQDAVRIIKALPSAEAVHGEWVRKYDGKINCYWYECDQCGEYRPRNQFGKEYNANFCPNCGAIMLGGDTE